MHIFITNAIRKLKCKISCYNIHIDKLKNATIAIDIHGELPERFKIKAPLLLLYTTRKGSFKKIFRGAVTIKKIVKYLY